MRKCTAVFSLLIQQTLFQFWIVTILVFGSRDIVMWTWCCRKLCPCCCCCCPWCCHGKDGDLAELLTSAENGNNNEDLQYYTVRKLASLRATSSQEDIDSSLDLPISNWTKRPQPRGNANEQLGSPAVYWTPTIHKVQPELDTSIESDPVSTSTSFDSSSRWHRSFNTIRPRTSPEGIMPLVDKNPGRAGGDRVSEVAISPSAMSAPNLAGDTPRRRRDHCIPSSKSSPRLQHSGTVEDLTLLKFNEKPSHFLKSQSMQGLASPRTTITPGDTRQEPNGVALSYGIDTTLYPKSRSALVSWRDAGEDTYRELTYGEVQFSVAYLDISKKLFVHVARVHNLPPKGVCFKYSVALKIAVLPNEKQAKVTHTQTGVSSVGEINAEFSDEFHFFLKDLPGRVLRISVFDADFMGRYDAIGHALYYLEDVPSGKRTPLNMKLYRQSQPDQYPGSLEVSLHYDASQDKMTVKVMQARNLALSPQATHNWRSTENMSTYVKVTYFCAGKRIKSSRSQSISNSRNPIYNHTAEFILASNYPHEIYFVVQVLLPGLIRKDPPVGRLIFGPFYFADDRTETPWGLAMRTNEVVSHWYNMYL